jgi:hypothetical protein
VKSLPLHLALWSWIVLVCGPIAPAAEAPGFQIEGGNLRARLSTAGRIAALKFADAAEQAWTAETGLADCRQEGDARATRLPQGGVQFNKKFVHTATQQRAVVVERFLPQKDSIRWECEVRGEAGPWSTPLETRFQCPTA